MEIQSFGKDLVDILAKRSLETLRSTQMPDLREVLSGRIFRPARGVGIGTAIGALVVGVGIGAAVTVFITPVSGPELRKRVARSAKNARQQLSTVSSSVADELDRAGRAIEHSVEGMKDRTMKATSPRASKPTAAKRGANGHAHLNGAKKRPIRQADA